MKYRLTFIGILIAFVIYNLIFINPVYAHHGIPHGQTEWTLFTIFTIIPILVFILFFLKTKNK